MCVWGGGGCYQPGVYMPPLKALFLVAIRIVQCLFLNPKFQAPNHQWLYRLVCVRPGEKLRLLVFSVAHFRLYKVTKVNLGGKKIQVSPCLPSDQEKTSLQCSRPGLRQAGLYSLRKRLKA